MRRARLFVPLYVDPYEPNIDPILRQEVAVMGTFIIYLVQPYGEFAKTLLERQVYPEIREYPGAPLKTPYDVVAHTLPLLMGVEAIKVDKPFQVKSTLLETINKPKGGLKAVENAFGYAWGHVTNDDIVALNRLLKKGYRVFWSAENFEAGGKTCPPGTMVVQQRRPLWINMSSFFLEG